MPKAKLGQRVFAILSVAEKQLGCNLLWAEVRSRGWPCSVDQAARDFVAAWCVAVFPFPDLRVKGGRVALISLLSSERTKLTYVDSFI